jgi:hypothetical protein
LGRINIVLSDDVEHKLRKALVDNPDFGGKKGDLSEAIEIAINEWIEKNDKGQERKKRTS